MAVTALILLFMGALASRSLTRRELTFDIPELARLSLMSYLLFLLASLPLVWTDQWGVSQLVGVLLGGNLVVWGYLWLSQSLPRLSFPSLSWLGWAILFSLIVGASLQRYGIYHVYATHDPSAYLNGAINTARTGSVFHFNPIKELAVTDDYPELRVLVEELEPGPLPTNYGLLSKDGGTSSYHGVFGTQLILAFGEAFFGRAHMLQIHWIHLLVSMLCAVALLMKFVGRDSPFLCLAPLLLAVNPLICLIFREPLSEPLAQVFFVGMLFASFDLDEERHWALSTFILCAGAALLVRVSGILYVPFVYLVAAMHPPLSRSGRWFEGGAWFSFLLCVGTAAYTSGGYILEILLYYSRILWPGVTPWSLGMLLMLGNVLAAVAYLFIRKHRNSILRLSNNHRFKSWAFGSFFFLLAAGLSYRYGKVFLVLTQYFGGFPFVTFHLESLLFYAGPVLVVLGHWYWFRAIWKGTDSTFLFLKLYLPFCVFFYYVFRFLPLDLQPNFQRYLTIELVPLCVIGTVILLSRFRSPLWVRSLFFFQLAWNLVLLSLINHPNISRGGLAHYERSVGALQAKFSQPVLIANKPTWRDLTYLYPYSYGFGIPVLTAHQGMNEEERLAVDTLESLGYQPLLVQNRSRGNQIEGQANWRVWQELDSCFQYPRFFLAAPPLDLHQTCHRLAVFKAEPLAEPHLP